MDFRGLKFSDFLKKFDAFGKGEWITVYSSSRDDDGSTGFYCALIAEDRIEQSLSITSWDLHIGDGLPGISFHFENNKQLWTYSLKNI